MNIEQALEAAYGGRDEGLLGLYPMAAQVLADAVRDLRAQLKSANNFAELWYFAMDEKPMQCETIFATYPPARWMDEVAALRRSLKG